MKIDRIDIYSNLRYTIQICMNIHYIYIHSVVSRKIAAPSSIMKHSVGAMIRVEIDVISIINTKTGVYSRGPGVVVAYSIL